MPEHRIAFRRAWESPTGRIDLPTFWGALPIPDQIRRSFHRPTGDPATDRLFLRLDDVAGLRGVNLNGEDLATPDDTQTGGEIPLAGRVRASNQLVLTLDPERVPRGAEWGRVWLVIRS